jgi:ABC-type transport system involved in multi-copper enzyme maturation permease subunit
MFTTMRYVLLVAMRDRLLLMLFFGLLVITGVSYSLANTMMTEQHQTALVFAAESSRIALVIGIIVFVVFHVRQAYDSREIDVMLSRPISRANLVIAYWLGFAIISILLATIAALTVGFLMPISLKGYIMWVASLTSELWLMAAFSLFASLILNSAVSSVMTSLAIYVLSRMMGFFLATVYARMAIDDLALHRLLRKALDIVSSVTPRLDFFTKSEWLIYGSKNMLQDTLLFSGQTLVFVPFLLLATIVDLNKRQF